MAYGCYDGYVRLYYLESGAVKTLGYHPDKVKDVDITVEVMPKDQMETVAVVSGSRDGSIKIWWDGGYAFSCEKKHHTPIVQVLGN